MKNIQTISATQARNNFFTIIDESYKKKKGFMIEKSNIPLVYIIPVLEQPSDTTTISEENKHNLKILEDLKKFRKSMKISPDSVKLIREMRRYGK